MASVENIRNYAISGFKALDCSGLARVDFCRPGGWADLHK